MPVAAVCGNPLSDAEGQGSTVVVQEIRAGQLELEARSVGRHAKDRLSSICHPEVDVVEEGVAVVRDLAEHVRVGFALATLVVDEGHGGRPQYDAGACSCKSDPAGRSWRCYLAKLRKKGRSYVLSDLYAVGTYDQSLLEGRDGGACLQRYHIPPSYLPHNPHVSRIGYENLTYPVSVGGA
jgi:hypothetical protein